MTFRRPHLVLSSAFLLSNATGFLAVAIPLIAKERLDASPGLLGIYGFAASALYVFTAWYSGPLLERFGRRRMLLISEGALVAGTLLAIFGQHRLFLLIPVTWNGGAMGLFWPALEATMSDEQSPSQIKRATGYFNFSWMTGMVTGPFLAGVLYSMHHDLPLAGALLISAVALFMLHLPRAMEVVPWGETRRFEHEDRVPADKRVLFIQLAFIANAIVTFSNASFRTLLPEYSVKAGISEFHYGLLQSGLTAGMVTTNALLVAWPGWHYSLRFFFGAQLCGVALLILLASVSHFAALLGLVFLLGFPIGVAYFSSIFYGLEQLKKKGHHTGNHEAVIGAGASLGPLLGGWVIGLSGNPRGNLVFSAVLIVVSIVVQARLVRTRLSKADRASS